MELNENINNSDYIKTIKESKEIIKKKENKINLLEKEFNEYWNNNLDDTYDNFNIGDKEPIHLLTDHTSEIVCSTVLKDGRFVTGSVDKSIIIYNNKTFTPDLIIKEHEESINSLIQLSSGYLSSGSTDKTIKIYNINKNDYSVIQILNYHTKGVTKLIELNNKQLISCSWDGSIIFYKQNNDKYKKDYSISTNGENGPIIQTKYNEICYYEGNNTICFYDLNKKKINKIINNISVAHYIWDSLLMISKDLLLITGDNIISIVNINSYELIKSIKLFGSERVFTACILNKNIILTGDENGRIIQWKIEKDNLKLIYIKENAHDNWIFTLSKLGNGLILSGSKDKSIKIW